MRVVLDTCILVSSLRSSTGASFKIVSSLPDRKFTTVVSTPVMLEYEEVLLRTGVVTKISKQDISDFLDYFASISEPIKVGYLWRPFLTDTDDDMILELAFNGRAEAIVTYNLADFKGIQKLGIKAISPSQFIKETKL